MVQRVRNYIDGAWVPVKGQNHHTVTVFNPATEEVLAYTPLGDAEDVEAAVTAAQQAFLSWRKVPAQDRIQYLFKIKQLMETHVEELSALITEEHGKTLEESRGSVRRAIQMVEVACGMPTLMMGENFEDIARGIDSYSVNRPLGVFAGVAPFNFPAMVPFWFWPFAIAAGNTFVLKASERVPLTSVRVFELLHMAGLPAGVMNLVQGGKDVVDGLCTHPLVKGISFVGSTPVAKHVYTLGAASGKRVQALGGAKNIMVAMPDTLQGSAKDRALATAVESITGCAGERCLAGSLILCVGEHTYEAWQEGVVEVAQKIMVGNGKDPEVQMGPLISAEAKERVSGLIARATQEGAELLLDGRLGLEKQKGYFLKPTVLAGIKPTMEIAQVEVFGPVILLAKVASLDAAIAWINALPYANTSTIFTSSGGHARKFATEVDPSMIGINIGVPAPMAFFSFGGSKDSFFGDTKAHGKASVRFYTDTYTTIARWHSESSIW